MNNRFIRLTVCLIALLPAAAMAQDSAQFLLGADISALAGGRGGRGGGRGGPSTYQEDGETQSEFAIMMKHGWKAYRLRVFVAPVRQAPNNSLENTIALAKQIKAARDLALKDLIDRQLIVQSFAKEKFELPDHFVDERVECLVADLGLDTTEQPPGRVMDIHRCQVGQRPAATVLMLNQARPARSGCDQRVTPQQRLQLGLLIS